MTRFAGEILLVRDLYEQGYPVAEVARRAGLPRSTVRTWIKAGLAGVIEQRAKRYLLAESCDPCPWVLNLAELPYAYLLGMYLGDGCITELARTSRLRVTLDEKYPNIIAECKAAIEALLPNRVGHVQRQGCVDVSCYSKHWPCLFPQHGSGPKHLRSIVLEPWQTWVAIERHPQSLLRGLIHSDGCRGTNTIKTKSGTYSYPRYQFSNRSAGIRSIFAAACQRAGIECRQSNEWTLSISKRIDIERMDSFIGPKT